MVMHDWFAAIRAKDVGQVRELLAQDASLVGLVAESGDTPVLTAVYHGAWDVVDLLLERGAAVNVLSKNGLANTPLHAALAGNHAAAASELLRAGADVNLADGSGWTPLHLAAANGNEAMVPRLLGAGARCDAVTAKGETALGLAMEKGHAGVVALLG